jgi:paired amphipathic helix protein Sin3a
MTTQILRRDDNTFEMDDLTSEARWSYYVSTYTMRDPTEGVPMHMLRMPFLKRNLPARTESEDEYNDKYLPVDHKDSLIIRICTNSYHILYEPDTTDWWVHSKKIRGVVSGEKMMKIRESRKSKLNDKFVMNAAWMKDQSRDFVDGVKEDFRQWIENGKRKEETGKGPKVSQDDDMVDDVE